jgi:hypothetical protein
MRYFKFYKVIAPSPKQGLNARVPQDVNARGTLAFLYLRCCK